MEASPLASRQTGVSVMDSRPNGRSSAGFWRHSDSNRTTPRIAKMASADFCRFGQGNTLVVGSAQTDHDRMSLNLQHNLRRTGAGLVKGACLAGVVGFEPTVHDTKNRCLTTWLHPSVGRCLASGTHARKTK